MTSVLELRPLGGTALPVSRLGLGLAAVARPGYITLGRDRDLPGDRSPDALYRRCAELLDTALELGIRYVDVARSYGRAEEFLARWTRERDVPPGGVAIASKWGYRYTAEWAVDARMHEQKELSLERFRLQLNESRQVLGDRIDLYQIHSATLESAVLQDTALLDAMVAAKRKGQVGLLGITLSGPDSQRALDQAIVLTRDGERVFDAVQATCNILEPSLLPSLARASDAGLGVIVKEVHANGRLTPANRRDEDSELVAELGEMARESGMSIDQLAITFVAARPFVDVVNSGAATTEQLRSHAAAVSRDPDQELPRALGRFAEKPSAYWARRSKLPWN